MRHHDLHEPTGNEFEPGSEGRVLRNLLGITDQREMELVESQYLARAQERFFDELDADHSFKLADLKNMHLRWLGKVYPFAGRLRQVEMGKDGFQFATVQFLETNLALFEANFLERFTPCHENSIESVAGSLAKVHGEFIMLHPFREGNGRLGRWLSDAMAAQSGLPLPRYGFTRHDEQGLRAQYLKAVKQAVLAEYGELTSFFAEALQRALEGASEDQLP